MRVLVVHNNYSSRIPSGENHAVRDEMAWLAEAGVDVVPHESNNDDVFDGGGLQRVRQAAEAVWSVSEQRRFERAIERARPDLVHVHNLFPLLSASVPWRAVRRDLPVVWTVHNRRVRCVGGTNFRAGEPCTLCKPGRRLPGIRHACYGGGSTMASALVTASSSLFATIARRRVTPVAISEAVRDWLVDSAGFKADRIQVKYNGVEVPEVSATATPPADSRTFLFAGQMSPHKGVRLLLDAWQRSDLPDDAELQLLGDGTLTDEVQQAAKRDPRIVWHGLVPAEEALARMATSRAVVVPSIWEEPFGRVAAEAMACGRPVITSGAGGLREVVDADSGWITGTDVGALAEAITTAARSDAAVTDRGAAAARRHDNLFSPAATTQSLLDIYTSVLDSSR